MCCGRDEVMTQLVRGCTQAMKDMLPVDIVKETGSLIKSAIARLSVSFRWAAWATKHLRAHKMA